MFADRDELFALGLEMSDSALYRVSVATACAYCRTPPAPRGVHNPHKMSEWVELYGRQLGNWSEAAPAVGGGSERPRIELDDDETKCLVCDSQLDATIGIPTHILAPICRAGLSEGQREFLECELVLPICGVCRFSPHARVESAARILKRYIDFRFHDPTAFELSDYSDVAREIAGLVAREVEIQRQERRVMGF